jgi:hypothetical protein
MSKLAIFVEGQTEQIFIEKLLVELAGRENLDTEVIHFSGGSGANKRVRSIKTKLKNTGLAKHILSIYNSQNDSRVVSDLRDQYDSLVKNGYTAIVAIRDVYPNPDLKMIRKYMGHGVKTSPVRPLTVLAVMETEAWFIAEHSHFPKIDARLTVEEVIKVIGLNPVKDDVQTLFNPAKNLREIYSKVGKSYDKSRSTVESTVETLDYEVIYTTFGDKFSDLKSLFSLVDEFLKA